MAKNNPQKGMPKTTEMPMKRPAGMPPKTMPMTTGDMQKQRERMPRKGK